MTVSYVAAGADTQLMRREHWSEPPLSYFRPSSSHIGVRI